MPICPECNSKRIYKNGIRYTNEGQIQRFLCRDCGYRFSEKPFKECQTSNTCQIGVLEAKNLVSQTEIKTVAGGIGKRQQEIKGKIIEYALKLRNKGRTKETIRTYIGSLYTLINKGADLLNPENVEDVIARQENWSIRAKLNYTDWYSQFAKFMHFDWEKPIYKAPNKIPFFPYESEIDQLIAGTSKKVSISLQIAKETAARIGEIVRIKWIDIDFQKNILAINEPEKGSNTNIYNVSINLITRIELLPKTHDRILGKASTDSLANGLLTAKKRLAHSFCNPRLLKIHFHTLRHWKLTTYAHEVKDPFLVQLFARHKDLKSTSRYIHYAEVMYKNTDNNKFTVRAVKSVEEAVDLMKVGFEAHAKIKGYTLFRKRK